MPGYIIHMSCGKILLDNLATDTELNSIVPSDEQKKQFMAGLIMPDAAKLSQLDNASELDRLEHYPADDKSYFKTPDMGRFLKKHTITLSSWYYIGYALHLYLDIKYDDYLKGKVTFVPGNTGAGPLFKRGSNEWQADIFWNMIYNDYTNSNRHFINKHNIQIDDLPVLLDMKIQAQKLSWYSSLYDKVKDIINNSAAANTLFFDVDEIETVINNVAQDFIKIYIKPLLSHSNNNVSSSSSNNLTSSEDNDSNWKAEIQKMEYFKVCWNSLVNSGVVDSKEEKYMEIVVTEIRDFDIHAQKHKIKNKHSLFILSLLPLVVGVITALSEIIGYECTKLRSMLVVISSVISFAITALTQYWNRASHKETWIRYRMIYSNLINETECFCERLNGYSELDDYEAVKKYMTQINAIRNEDYKTFEKNMENLN